MTLLPIVGRELRVAARRRGTYWNRTLTAFVAIALTAVLLLLATREPTKEIGKMLFSMLSGLFFLTSFLAGIRYTADCLSEEKREGTLGLLFLTDLKGYDVVFGKLAATSLNAFYGLMSILPVMAIPLLLGGVSVNEFWRMALVLANTMFFSLAIGMFASSINRSARKAMAATFALLLLVNAGPPSVGAYVAYANRLNAVPEQYLLSSAGYSYTLAFDQFYRTQASQFLWSVLLTHGMGWLFLAFANIGARRAWQDRPAGAARLRWRERWLQWSYGNTSERRAFRTRRLDRNPCFWLGGRHRLKPMLVWGILGVLGCCWFWAYLKWKDDWLNEATYVFTAVLLHTMLKLWAASEACQKFGADRRSGALELLLSTPLTVREVLRGQMLSLRRQFLAPVAAVVAVDFVFMFAGYSQVSVSGGSFWTWFCLAGISSFVADIYTLCWTGMWLGLTSKHINRATGATVVRVLVLPWLALGGMLLAISVLELWRHVDDSEYFILGSWFALGILNDLVFCLWARARLLGRLRTVATERYSPSRSWIGRWSRRREPGASAMPPVMAQ